MKQIHLIAAARPNFMKIAPLYHEFVKQEWCEIKIIHTGQHYDPEMSGSFFHDLMLPQPHFNLGIGKGSHAEQTAGVMVEYEKLCQRHRPDWVVVVGDVNSTMAVSIAAKKLQISVAHMEAGLRSGDRSMPEEINRLITDSIADILWTPSPDGDSNLRNEGIAEEKIICVGNVMIDSFEMLRGKIEKDNAIRTLVGGMSDYGVVTLHRPANVDKEEQLNQIIKKLISLSHNKVLVFPIHPRTRARLKEFRLMEGLEAAPNLKLLPPQNYISFMNLVLHSSFVVTDSGGIQEETSYLNIPCYTLRPNTERPITITHGTNTLIEMTQLPDIVIDTLSDKSEKARKIDLWDGSTAKRVVENLKKHCLGD